MIIFNTLDDLGAWCEGCACHEGLLRNNSGHLSRASLAKLIGNHHADCPNEGQACTRAGRRPPSANIERIVGPHGGELVRACCRAGAAIRWVADCSQGPRGRQSSPRVGLTSQDGFLGEATLEALCIVSSRCCHRSSSGAVLLGYVRWNR